MQLTERDSALLVDIYRYRYLSVSQVQRLRFPSLQVAYRRLRVLTELKYVEPFSVPTVPERLFHLTRAGAECVAAHLGVAPVDLKWSEHTRAPKDHYFVQHFLKISDFRIALSEQCAGAGLQLLGFIPEYYGRKTDAGGMHKYIKDVICDGTCQRLSHTPDAVFALARDGRSALFFLEIDCGTETVSVEDKGVLKSVCFYAQYLTAGHYRRYEADFSCTFNGFRALIITTAAARIANIRAAAAGLSSFPEKAKRFIWLTTHEQLASGGLFAPIWRSADARDQTQYQIH